MFNPVSTYRIQFHKGFTFKNFMHILPYLHQLGVNTIYASPIFEAVPGSNHGYDVTNPHRINPEIGTLEELEAIGTRLKDLGMHWLQDIVPNHMAFDPRNSWLMDVLEKGKGSAYAHFFDIIWDAPAFNGKLMVPFLGAPLSEVIAGNELSVLYRDGQFTLQYAGQRYPLNSASILQILSFDTAAQPGELRKYLSALKKETSIHSFNEFLDTAGSAKGNIDKYIGLAVDHVNNHKHLLTLIAEQQYYQLTCWKDSNSAINYRRFFTVNGLICLNIQDEAVFAEYHRFLKTLLDKGLIQGLRVDHIDGLFDPTAYLERLRALAGPECYIVVEKILEQGEAFPAHWPVQGNTGYDFLGVVNNVFSETQSKKAFTEFYRQLSNSHKPINKATTEKKADILYGHMAGELDNLYHLLLQLKPADRHELQDITLDMWKLTIAGFLILCPVYRYYGNQMPLGPQEAEAVSAILQQVAAANLHLAKSTKYMEILFTGNNFNEKDQVKILNFYQRCMQFTGPLMAKGVEDTLMYTYERFIVHNEVGDSPAEFGIDIDQFHNWMKARQEHWPMSMNGTSSHDTKRGEDVRARLNVLSDIPEKWFNQVNTWRNSYKKFKKADAPDANDEYLIYQTLAGFITLPGQPEDETAERLTAYLTKALREAKTHTEWAEPDDSYEHATLQFANQLLNDAGFLKSMNKLQQDITDGFICNSLNQVLFKFTCPGIPDLYQGCELWDFSLVDPDNRRPVDYRLRSNLLKTIKELKADQVWQQRHNGSLKLWLTHKLLLERKNYPELFNSGNYIPLQVAGRYKDQIAAFARMHQRQWFITISALHVAATENHMQDWADTRIVLPADAPLQWHNILTGKDIILDKEIELSSVLNSMPLTVLRSVPSKSSRSAGIILHITSLPSAYGIGDIGPEARNFASFLSSSHQRYWQLLPVNPTNAAEHYSPYSSFSSMAGNTMLISPDDLVTDELLTADETSKYKRLQNSSVNYAKVASSKSKLFEIAYNRFIQKKPKDLLHAYETFKADERSWLEDFSLYEVIKALHKGTPWYNWPEPFKCRELTTLNALKKSHRHELDRSMWLQFIFLRQWKALKAFVHQNGLLLLGDIPFYISYDSADVWAHPVLFGLDADKNIERVAGVPPDYFNAGGQLWNMPVYNWPEHKATDYAWWINRMKKNEEMYDLVRLDHFRGFYDFWEVPASEKNAIRGLWQSGPGAEMLHSLKKELGGMPFIAEDLGDINDGVYRLRDRFKLPGMNVLQYAFGNDMPVSVHAPHNHIPNSVTYTGTHDNNTTLGWFNKDITPVEKQNLFSYFRIKANRSNINQLMNEACYASAAEIAIIPLQDILKLDERFRMNKPGAKTGNWGWRVDKEKLTEKLAASLRLLVKKFNR
ncbi:malto-oligosyltrehalose synthase [Mucilaginibacter sp. SMC90]|uniref:malto-oligosyltrehalose synthase n=1 Tax=Mucilaginibacter sp. SMC90 TaxID=2929803 RepID=UPI001FB41F4A|nr:malto-oligosyltrehalose synthase [Mucilaginibacter sp. SMC90]UOE52081.1 malto-oligosyltrehalose synthase [Mucilaginibacter sp. SMC90]